MAPETRVFQAALSYTESTSITVAFCPVAFCPSGLLSGTPIIRTRQLAVWPS